jgi:hypothetical protein
VEKTGAFFKFQAFKQIMCKKNKISLSDEIADG